MLTINVMRGFSVPLALNEGAGTIAIGDPAIIGVNTIKPELLMINGQDTGSTSLTIIGKSGKIYQYRIQVGNDLLQLKALIASIERKVTVEDFNGTIVLKGEVSTAAALTRVLSVADRFVSNGVGEPDFSVVSDRGGVLAGDVDEKDVTAGYSPEQSMSVQTVAVGGAGRGAGSGGRNNGGGSNGSQAISQPIMPPKGNLAQNLSRGNVIMAAKGKVISLIRVISQPKVEIQMQIVAVDRNKTDELGIDWRLDLFGGSKYVMVQSKLGGIVPGLPTPKQVETEPIDFGTATNALGIISPGRYVLSTFLRAIEEKGAGKSLSEPLVTAISGESASFLVGGNIPIPVQTLSAGNATSNAAVTTNVQFIQFGLRLIVRPTVLENGKIVIVLDQSITQPDYTKAIQILGAPIPSFSQRSVSTVTESSSGETWAVAGLLTEEDTKTLKSVPWLSKVPVLGWLFENKIEDKSRNELMILVNARRIDGINDTTTNFDAKGNLAPEYSDRGMVDNQVMPEQAAQPSAPPADKKVPPNNKKSQQRRVPEQTNLLNNSSTRFAQPTQSFIKPRAPNGRVYREIVNPNLSKNTLDYVD